MISITRSHLLDALALAASGLVVLAAGVLPAEAAATVYVLVIGAMVWRGAARAHWNVLDPRVWFVPILVLYHVSIFLLFLGGVYRWSAGFHTVARLTWLAAAVLLLVLPARSVDGTDIRRLRFSRGINAGILPAFALAGSVAIVYLLALWQSGVTSKFEKATSSGILNADFSFSILLVVGSLVVVRRMVKGRRFPLWGAAALLTFFLFASVVSGERDLFFRAGLVLGLLWCVDRGGVSPIVLAALGIVGLCSATILGDVKMAPLRGAVERVDRGSAIAFLLGGELRTAGENLTSLVEDVPANVPYSSGKSILDDLKRVLVPGFLVDRRSYPNTEFWFLQRHFPLIFERGGGVGFTLVGVGYLAFGMIGVVFLFLLLGAFLRVLGGFARERGVVLVGYVNFIPILMFSSRSDLSTPLSQGLKHVALPLLAIAVTGTIATGAIFRWSRPSGIGRESDG